MLKTKKEVIQILDFDYFKHIEDKNKLSIIQEVENKSYYSTVSLEKDKILLQVYPKEKNGVIKDKFLKFEVKEQ